RRWMGLVEIFQDGQRLKQDRPVAGVKRGDHHLRIDRAERRVPLLALGQVDIDRVISDALEVERDAHAKGRQRSPEGEQPHRCSSTISARIWARARAVHARLRLAPGHESAKACALKLGPLSLLWPGLSRPSTSVPAARKDVDARDKPGHDGMIPCVQQEVPMTRLPELDLADLSPEQRKVHDAILAGPRGTVRGPLLAWLHSAE